MPDKNHQIDFLVRAFFKMPDKIQINDFLVMGFSEMPDRMPANEVLSGIKKRAAPRAARRFLVVSKNAPPHGQRAASI